jgi:hypothetical protein
MINELILKKNRRKNRLRCKHFNSKSTTILMECLLYITEEEINLEGLMI